MGATWVLSAPDGTDVDRMNLATMLLLGDASQQKWLAFHTKFIFNMIIINAI